jgi:hypothetical protein
MRVDKYLAKKDLKNGTYYNGRCRNSRVAVWDATNQVFWYVRNKWGCYFPEEICHPEDDNGFDLYYPVNECPDPMTFECGKIDLAEVSARK